MKKTVLVLAGTILLAQTLLGEEPKIIQKEMPLTQMQKQNRTIVKMAAEELSKTLPQKVDEYTTLTKIEGKDETLVYDFEINTGAKSDEAVRKEDRTRMQKAVTKGICRSSKRFLDADISISYIYRSAKSQKELFRFDVKKENCRDL